MAYGLGGGATYALGGPTRACSDGGTAGQDRAGQGSSGPEEHAEPCQGCRFDSVCCSGLGFSRPANVILGGSVAREQYGGALYVVCIEHYIRVILIFMNF